MPPAIRSPRRRTTRPADPDIQSAEHGGAVGALIVRPSVIRGSPLRAPGPRAQAQSYGFLPDTVRLWVRIGAAGRPRTPSDHNAVAQCQCLTLTAAIRGRTSAFQD